MKCTIMRWMISHSLDSESAFPTLVKKHLASCNHCREFAAVADEACMVLARDADKVANPDRLFEAPEQTVSSPYFGRLALAAACSVIVVGLAVHNVEKPEPADLAILTPSAIMEYMPSETELLSPVTQMENEIAAVQKDMVALGETLTSSAQIFSGQTIAGLIF